MAKDKLVKNSIIVMILIFIGKILAFVRDALIAAKFGATYSTDVYLFSLGIVTLLASISYGLTTTFIPIQTALIEKTNIEDRNRFVNNVLNIFSIFTIFISVFGMFFSKYIVYIFAPGFSQNVVVFNSAINVIRIMFASLIFVSLQSVLTGVLQSHNQFYEPNSMAIFSNIVFIIYLVFLTSKFGLNGFAVATVLGFFVQFAINVPKYKKLGYKYYFFIDLKDSRMKKLFLLMIPVVISTSVVQLNLFVNRFFATTIVEGAVTALDFSNKLNILVYEVFAIAISTVIYPTLSYFAAKDDRSGYNRTLIKGINIVLMIMVPAAVAMAVLRVPVIEIVFKRGAFNQKAVSMTSFALLCYCPAMVGYGVRDILNKAFYSIKNTRVPMMNSLLGIVINIVLNLIFIKYLGVAGLALATSISVIFTTILLLIDLNRKLEDIGLNKIINTFFKICASSIFMGLIIFTINKFTLIKFGHIMKGDLISIVLNFILGSSFYIIFLYLFEIEELLYFFNIIRGRINKNK